MSHKERKSRLCDLNTLEAIHLDVRGLEPPAPMVTILRMIDAGEAGDRMIIHLDREPVFLYPELDDRDWNYEVVVPSGDDLRDKGEVIVLLTRRSP